VINLRYHIVSITAVFLALGIGLTLGSSFLDRVTVDNLKSQLETVQERVGKSEAANDSLTGRVTAFEQRDEDLANELAERTLAGHLEAVPVLLLATEGTDDALVDQAVATLTSAGAQVAGTWTFTDRWLLDDPEEVTELAAILELTTDDADRLRRNAAIRMAEVLDIASQAPVSEVPTNPAVPPTPPAAAVPGEPELIRRLQNAGFVDYRPLPGSGDERVLLPAGGSRFVAVSGALPEAGPSLFAAVLLDEMVAGGPAPLVAAQGEVDLPDGADGKEPASEDQRRSSFVGPLREGELTRDRLSTIDDLDTAAGLVALVLSVEDLGAQRLGHYGVASGAARLLPGADTSS